jgi:transcriptional regulator with XRE-family HTH domain
MHQTDLATRAKVARKTLSDFEAGKPIKPRTIDAIQGALEAAGVQFIAQNGGGEGVRLAEPAKL